jgi:hypothetical protein
MPDACSETPDPSTCNKSRSRSGERGQASLPSPTVVGVSSGRLKVGVLDDPIWKEPPPPVTSLRTRRRNPLRTMALLGVALVIAATCVIWLLSSHHRSGGDPGGRILRELRTISKAVPPNATVAYAHYDEPMWDSCDGRAGTGGWDKVVVQINFAWSGSPTGLIGRVRTVLEQSGWGNYRPLVNDGIPGAEWSKNLQTGTGASVQLTAEPDGSWTLIGQALPVGTRTSGC